MKKHIVALGVLMISLIVSACGDKGASSALFTVDGVVSGLTGTLVLQNKGGDDLMVTANGSFTFPTALAPGSSYAVTVLTNPPGQTCVVSKGTGTILIANIKNVLVDCFERGGLDVTFNAPNGFTVQNNAAGGNADDFGNAVAIDSKGRILSAGSSTNSAGDMDMVVWRFKTDGTLDATFNGGGVIVQNNSSGGTGDASGKAIAVDSQGRILVTGSTTSAGYTDMAVWRFNANGTVDKSFNKSGLVINNGAAGGNADDSSKAIAIDSQDRILVTGSTTSAGNTDMVVWRFKADGTIDTTFNGSGITVQNNAAGGSGDDSGNAIAVDSQGRILVAGSSTTSAGDTDMVVWRFKADGTLDTTFNGSGLVVNNGAAGGNGDDSGKAIAVDSQGRILVTGSSKNIAGDTDMVVWRFNADGALDITFAANGIASHNGAAWAGGTGDDSGNAIAVDSQDKILIAGSSGNSAGNSDMVVWRVFP